MMDKGRLISVLSHHYGSGSFSLHRDILNKKYILTEGMQELLEFGECYWLLDVITSHLSINSALSHESMDGFVAINIIRTSDTGFTVAFDDGNGEIIAMQKIDFSDFVLDKQTIFAEHNGECWTLLLPAEH